MNALYLTLLLPLSGAIVLALVRSPVVAGWINIGVCVGTFLASLSMALTVLREGPFLSDNGMFYIDAFNVYLVVLTGFVGINSVPISRPLASRKSLPNNCSARVLRISTSQLRLKTITGAGIRRQSCSKNPDSGTGP